MSRMRKNKYGLQEYSFEIGWTDDSTKCVSIVGQEFSYVSDSDKFYLKEDVDALIEQYIEANKVDRDRYEKRINFVYGLYQATKRALYKAIANWALSMVMITDITEFGEPAKWMAVKDRCLKKSKEWRL